MTVNALLLNYVVPFIICYLIFSWVCPLFLHKVFNKFVLALLSLLVLSCPIGEVLVIQEMRVFTNHMSITSLLILGLISLNTFFPGLQYPKQEIHTASLTIFAVSLLFYPLTLGISHIDPYRWGYQPFILSMFIIGISALTWTIGYRLIPLVLLMSLVAFKGELLPSSNLWDYLIDPFCLVFASIYLVLRHQNIIKKGFSVINPLSELQRLKPIEITLIVSGITVVGVGVVLSYLKPNFFNNLYVVEDGLVEWLTVFNLLACSCICLNRSYMAYKHQASVAFVLMSLAALIFIFGAGEELSWGQRLFDIESPRFFLQHNAQNEMNLHNLKIGEIKINKLVFGKLLAIFILIYLGVLVSLYHLKTHIKHRIDGMGVPIPQKYQIILISAIFLTASLTATSKRGELIEFGTTLCFLLILLQPYNKREIAYDSVRA